MTTKLPAALLREAIRASAASRNAHDATLICQMCPRTRSKGRRAIELRPDDYAKLLDYGIGLTDLTKGACGADSNLKPADFDRMHLRAVVKARSPRLLAFNGKTAAARCFEVPTAQINYGRQADTIGRTVVYVCASTSPANGHWSREPWEELARVSKRRHATDVCLAVRARARAGRRPQKKAH